MPPLAGVVHAAGTLNDGLLQELSWDDFERVMAAKLRGAWALHDYTRDMDLDVFALFSSASALFGTPGQAAYAAANAGLDALASHRRALGLPGNSLLWGPWSEIGMAANVPEATMRAMARLGIKSLSVEHATQAFLDACAPANPAQSAILAIDPVTVATAGDQLSHRVFFRDLVHLVQPEDVAAAQASNQLLSSLRDINSRSKQQRFVRDWIVAALVRTSGIQSKDLVVEATLNSMGIDSIMIMELVTDVQTNFDIQLSLSAVSDGATINSLATEILDAFLTKQAASISEEDAAALGVTSDNSEDLGELMSRLDELSDEEISNLLEKISYESKNND